MYNILNSTRSIYLSIYLLRFLFLTIFILSRHLPTVTLMSSKLKAPSSSVYLCVSAGRYLCPYKHKPCFHYSVCMLHWQGWSWLSIPFNVFKVRTKGKGLGVKSDLHSVTWFYVAKPPSTSPSQSHPFDFLSPLGKDII